MATRCAVYILIYPASFGGEMGGEVTRESAQSNRIEQGGSTGVKSEEWSAECDVRRSVDCGYWMLGE